MVGERILRLRTEEWITIIPYKGENVNHIEFSVAKNPAPEARTGTIIVTTETEGIGPFEIPVTQEGMPEFLSTLTEDVQLASFSHNKVIVSPNNDYRDLPYTYWDLEILDRRNFAQQHSTVTRDG